VPQHLLNQWEAERHRKRAQIRQREDKEKREAKAERDDQNALDALGSIEQATPQEIEAFKADLTTYETATVAALMDIDARLEALQNQLDPLLLQAYQLPDGRYVFRTNDGTQVYDQNGSLISPDSLDPNLIPTSAPTWETVQPIFAEQKQLKAEREELLTFQEKLDEAQDQLNQGEITQAELQALKTDLEASLPPGVKAQLPATHPQAGQAVATSDPTAATPNLPSIGDLKGFAMPTP